MYYTLPWDPLPLHTGCCTAVIVSLCHILFCCVAMTLTQPTTAQRFFPALPPPQFAPLHASLPHFMGRNEPAVATFLCLWGAAKTAALSPCQAQIFSASSSLLSRNERVPDNELQPPQ